MVAVTPETMAGCEPGVVPGAGWPATGLPKVAPMLLIHSTMKSPGLTGFVAVGIWRFALVATAVPCPEKSSVKIFGARAETAIVSTLLTSVAVRTRI